MAKCTKKEPELGILAERIPFLYPGLPMTNFLFASRSGIPVTVVMPVVAPIMKVENCKKYGATVIIHGQNIGEARERALVMGQDKGYMYING